MTLMIEVPVESICADVYRAAARLMHDNPDMTMMTALVLCTSSYGKRWGRIRESITSELIDRTAGPVGDHEKVREWRIWQLCLMASMAETMPCVRW